MSTAFSPLIVWHDVECGGYAADLPLWRELAHAESGPVLDVGAGTGRVALDLAREAHRVTALEDFGGLPDALLPAPDVGTHAGWRFASQPTAVRTLSTATRIERMRRASGPGGAVSEEEDAIELARLTVEQLEAEGRAAGFSAEPARRIEATADHLGAEVVLLRA